MLVPVDIDVIEEIKETDQYDDGFNDLVLPDDHKAIVRALVKTHSRGPRYASTVKKPKGEAPAREVDLVKGKGKGLIILLHGSPGTGRLFMFPVNHSTHHHQVSPRQQSVSPPTRIAHCSLSPLVILDPLLLQRSSRTLRHTLTLLGSGAVYCFWMKLMSFWVSEHEETSRKIA